MQRLARLAHSFFARAQTPEILACFGRRVRIELEHDAPAFTPTNGHVEKDAWVLVDWHRDNERGGRFCRFVVGKMLVRLGHERALLASFFFTTQI